MGALQGDFADMAVHPQANYVMDALLELSSEEELAVVAEEMSDSFAQLVTHHWGQKLLQQAVEKMVRMIVHLFVGLCESIRQVAERRLVVSVVAVAVDVVDLSVSFSTAFTLNL